MRLTPAQVDTSSPSVIPDLIRVHPPKMSSRDLIWDPVPKNVIPDLIRDPAETN